RATYGVSRYGIVDLDSLSSSGRAPSFIVSQKAHLSFSGQGFDSSRATLTIRRTRAFRSFQRAVGDSTLLINSAYIGLELIARGGEKPPGLDINWSAPKNPRDVASKSRSLLHA